MVGVFGGRDLLLWISADMRWKAAVHGCGLVAQRNGMKQSLEIENILVFLNLNKKHKKSHNSEPN